ncbi:hypothetical protein ASG29_02525 [Sphingomonas sp. Leaf412]|uniref:16S rRNA (guanine(527)-N(7))-methyltransferase RsmG n=1 Tax=Sphingomonas sp. Leaf412 TaxID=1736370 RepID=UPI0006F853F3|nr:16S rRNA (guanine(527)-N(7))-methyltransferase RsmG [Sphingomonas sp. Leaf412]KQT35026.1 hypothetical protein ASG29_02525 [Sphingomonas sp. Leaf412]
MTEDDARAWIAARWGDAAVAKLERFASLVRDEAGRQNLVAPSTLDTIWARHIVDSAQLLTLAPERGGAWIDVGTGAGFPGLVVAMLRPLPTVLVEPRARRAAFLSSVAEALDLPFVKVEPVKVEMLRSPVADIVSARAVAPTMTLLRGTKHLRTPSTTVLFPRGRGGLAELANLPREWQAMFHVEHSLTDPDSVILVANGVT